MSTIYDELSNSSDVNQNDPNQEELFTTDTPSTNDQNHATRDDILEPEDQKE